MSLHSQPIACVPEQTARVARADFPNGNPFLLLRDELGTLFSAADFADLYPTHGQPAEAPWRLALVTVWQFMENLSDRKAADAVRARIDWKYALGLELDDAGFDSAVLCEFRSRLLEGSAEQRLLDTFLDVGRERGWFKARGWQRTDSTHVLGRIRALNRLQCVIETFRAAFNAIAIVAPSGSVTTAILNGSTVMGDSRRADCRPVKRNAKSWRSRWGLMAILCWMRSSLSPAPFGAERSPPSKH